MCILFHIVHLCDTQFHTFTLFHAFPCSSTLFNIVSSSSTLFHAFPQFSTLFHPVPHWSDLFHTVPCYSTLLRAASHYKTLLSSVLLPFSPLFRILVGYEYLANKAKVNYKHDNAYTVGTSLYFEKTEELSDGLRILAGTNIESRDSETVTVYWAAAIRQLGAFAL